MAMRAPDPKITKIPLNIVGSSIFGRYPKISTEKTTNMIISDGFLVPYAGYKLAVSIQEDTVARGLFSSYRWGKMIAVIGSTVYAISNGLTYDIIGNIATTSGDVFITENTNYQIAICDKFNIYIYNWSTLAFTTATIPEGFQPGYIEYQDARFISPDISTAANMAQWELSATNDGTMWPGTSAYVGLLQTKGDYAIATVRFPGRGNTLLVFGNIVTELWYDVGATLFPYQRSTSVNLDYGCANAATIAALENIVVWLGINEKSGPTIMYSNGGDITKISTDGIDFLLANLTNPTNSYGFLFRQDGHLLYQITFPDPNDNISLVYDFNTSKFFNLTNEDGNCHIAKRVVFFEDQYYFISFVDGNIYQMSSLLTTYDYGNGEVYDIPRGRICKNIRAEDQAPFSINYISFTTEQGTDLDANVGTDTTYFPMIYLSGSYDGGYTFSSQNGKAMFDYGHYRNRLIWHRLGRANDFVPQFQFWSSWRFVVTDGLVEIAQQ